MWQAFCEWIELIADFGKPAPVVGSAMFEA
jgi:hypothetical protein